jgi:tRNA (uracil-5-)-methyltransferase
VSKTNDEAKGKDSSMSGAEGVVMEDKGDHINRKICITDHKATSTEYIDDFRFDSPAGAFFQNNNSILPLITQYIRDNIFGPSNSNAPAVDKPRVINLVDAYSGSGFFTITLSALFTNSIGVDISADSIASATRNAELNNLPASSTKFIAADASALFKSLDRDKFKPEETVVVLDPPRKGCDESFVRQLVEFGPARVCYVSCNVHTQARDVGWLVGGFEKDGEKSGGLYEIESLRGFDFFPQTGHVEGVAILRKKSKLKTENEEDVQEKSAEES